MPIDQSKSLRAWAGGPRLGTAYYNEYLPDPGRLETDMALMVAAGISCIRVGESVWSTWEGRDGEYNLEWLTPILDAAHSHGIDVIIGTPTYAIPPWLSRKHPELAIVTRDGTRVPWGGRQEVDFTSPVFRTYAERVIRAILGRHGHHPALVGVQLDNEAGLHLIHNDHVVAAFRAWVAGRYGDPETLNREWGLTYWSHRIADFDELWAPRGNTTPAYQLAWRRFQAEQTADFIAWQAAIVRDLVPPEVFLTTCIAYQRPAMDDVAVADSLDIASGNAYYLAQDHLEFGRDGAGGQWYADDVAGLVLTADRMRASKHAPFLVTETGAGSIGPASLTLPPYDGQLAQAAWLLAARGARLVSYWHWHTLHSGAEVHWGGILGHDLVPGRIYDEVARIGAEFTAAAPALTGAVPDAEVGLLYSHDSEWVMANEPPLTGPGGDPDPKAYPRIVGAFGRAAIDAGRQVGYLNDRQLPDATTLVAQFPTLIAPGLIAASDATLATLVAYARAGGHLIVGPRTGYGDDEGRMRATTAPGFLSQAAGVSYSEWAALPDPIPVVSATGATGSARGWVDCLDPGDAEVLARYHHPHYGRWAGATRTRVGAGTITMVGSIFDRALLAEIVAEASAPTALIPPVRTRGTALTAHSLVGDAGRVWVVHNWSPDPVSTRIARAVTSATDASAHAAGSRVELGAWDARVWLES